jgi:hypothetical protein
VTQGILQVGSNSDVPFFRRENDLYLPTETARGYWAPDSLNGRMVVGLLGFELERLYGQEAWQPTRLTVDLFRLPRRAPVLLPTRVTRDGGRLRLVEADYICDGVKFGRASLLLLKRSEPASGERWTPRNWDAPAPHTVALEKEPGRGLPHWERRPIPREAGATGPQRCWFREVRPLVEGFAHTPFTRVATAADAASPMANTGSEGVGYINSDVTLYLHRLPATEWIGMETTNHQSSDGVAIGQCRVYDVQGSIGSVSVAAIPQQRRLNCNPPIGREA